jgi:YgiT-type zinc finger domain-containing protein
LVDEVFVINGKYVLVEGIPASICARCGEATFSRGTTERVRHMVHSEAQPVRTVVMDVFAYAQDRV